MRFGLRTKIVATIVGILAATLVVVIYGSNQVETRIVARADGPLPALPPAARLQKWYRARHTWTGADRFLASMTAPPFASIVVQDGVVRAASDPALRDAAARDQRDGLLLSPARVRARQGVAALRFERPPTEEIVLDGRVVGRFSFVASPATMPLPLRANADTAFRRRFLVVFGLVGATAIAIAYVLGSRIVEPIRALTLAARSASRAEVPHVDAHARDEIGELARAFNALGERLMHSEAARRNLISDVAHEVRTPLTNIRCALESFQDGIVEPTPDALASVVADVLLLQRLVSDLHELSVADAAPVGLACVPTDVPRDVRRAVRGFGDRARARNISIDVVTAPIPIPPVRCDPDRVRQVMHNLLENAVRFARPGGRVTVTITCDDERVRVAVVDDGDGFPATEEHAIFERFRRLDTSRSRATGGSGLGLAISKALVEAHGGRIGATGGAGNGATVWFTLPL